MLVSQEINMPTTLPQNSQITPEDVAKYFLYRAQQDGDLVSPLKMQKLVYYAYAWTLVRNNKQLFEEKIEAWANGPVVPSLYHQLKHYGSSPIRDDFLGSSDKEVDEIFSALTQKFNKDVLETLGMVYEVYMTKTAFELVLSTHSELPWKEARKGLASTERGSEPITDKSIRLQYGKA